MADQKIPQMKEVSHLKQRFFENLDANQLRGFWYALSENRPLKLQLLGEGRHFAVYRWQTESFPYVIKVASNDFLNRQGFKLNQWIAIMKKMKTMQIPLFPPFEIFYDSNMPLLMLMPYGEGQFEECSNVWQPLSHCIKNFHEALDQKGWILDDVIQGRTIQGLPFVCDLSDLRQK